MAGMAPSPDATKWLMMVMTPPTSTSNEEVDVMSHREEEALHEEAGVPDAVPLLSLRQSIIQHDCSGEFVSAALRSSPWSTMLDLVPTTPRPAVRCLSGRPPTTHQQLHHFISAQGSVLSAFGITKGVRVGVLVPNGPEAAVCLLSCVTWATCVPLNPLLSPEELRCDLLHLRCRAVITLDPSSCPDALPAPLVRSLLASLVQSGAIDTHLHAVPDPHHAGLFHLHLPPPSSSSRLQQQPPLLPPLPNSFDDLVLVLPTAGTSGRRKLVRYPLLNVVVGSACILSSWRLRPEDVDLNMMPLFHIGGIARNLFAPLLAGGSTVFATGFDARVFWDVVGPTGATWYYAAPTMHHCILQEHEEQEKEAQQTAGGRYAMVIKPQHAVTRIRFIANAAGPLPPSLAVALRSVFKGAAVLPSYGMTEWYVVDGSTLSMPISSPPLDYRLDRPGTSGKAVGPELSIREYDGSSTTGGSSITTRALAAGVMGRICVRGPPLFPGYEEDGGDEDGPGPAAAAAGGKKKAAAGIMADGWFDTGDLGYMDADGYLYITGRSKEVINRGGEIIAPVDVEDALLASPLLSVPSTTTTNGRILSCLAFAWPHATLQEVVGMVLVMSTQQPRRPSLPELGKHLSSSLHTAKWPQGIVFMDALPRGATGKPQRIRLASRLGLPVLTDAMTPRERLFEATCPPAGTGLHVSIACRQIDASLLITGAAVAAGAEGRYYHHHHHAPSLSSVTRALETQPEVWEAAIMVGSSNSSDVVAFVSVRRGATMQGIREGLAKEGVHGYLWPDRIVLLIDRPLPKDERGEGWDWHALLEQDKAARRREGSMMMLEGGMSPRGGADGELCQIFGEALGLGPETVVGADQDFFAMGGDSLRAGKLISLIRRRLGVSLPTHTLYSAGTATRLRQVILEHQSRKVAAATTTSTTARHADDDKIRRSQMKEGEEDTTSGKEHDVGLRRYVSGAGSPMMMVHDGYHRSPQWVVPDDITTNKPSPPQDRPMTLLVQLVPLLLLHPLARISTFTVFMMALVEMESIRQHSSPPTDATTIPPPSSFYSHYVGTLLRVSLALGCSFIYSNIILPLLAVAFKWLVVGRLPAGRYPLWGSSYLRFWLVDQALHIAGRGIFAWMNGSLLPSYLRLLGAHIGAGVRIDPQAHVSAPLAHLVHVDGKGTVLDSRCMIRPLAFQRGRMVTAPIRIGQGCLVGCRAVVAPGCHLRAGTSMATLSSSYDYCDHDADSSTHHQRGDAPTTTIIAPSSPTGAATTSAAPWSLKLLVGWPLLILARLVSLAPRLVCLSFLVLFFDLPRHSSSYLDLLLWFSTWQRGAYYLLVRVARVLISPPLYLATVLVIKHLVIGKFQPGPRTKWSSFQSWLMSALLPTGDLGGVAPLLGRHFEGISVVYRLLGATVGRRIYWPGSGLAITEYDLLDVGDDVVFGSRSLLLPGGSSPCLGSRELRRIVIQDGAMIADRCVLLGGCRVGRNAVLGSGGLCPADFSLKPGSVWLGAQQGRPVLWSHGDERAAMQEPTMSAFARAMYLGRAKFRGLMPVWQHALVNAVMVGVAACYWSLPLLLAFGLTVSACGVTRSDNGQPSSSSCSSVPALFLLLSCSYSLFVSLFSLLSLVLCVGAKWLLLGRRLPGHYSWDESPYCQRWKVFLAVEELRRAFASGRGVLDFLTGSGWLVWYFRAHGCRIGRNVCLYPCGADPMMTEPDLVTIGDDCVVDDASLIAHINTRGDFELRPLHLGRGCVMRARSRLLSGASLEDDVTLLEHTLVMSGEVAERGTTWQGWPATAPTTGSNNHHQQQDDKVGRF